MRFNPIPLIAASLFLCITAAAQTDSRTKLFLKSGTIQVSPNLSADHINAINRTRTTDKSFVIIQFYSAPNETIRQELKDAGIELLDYVPDNGYTATISKRIDMTMLNGKGVRAIIELNAEQKMSPRIARGNFPVHAVKVAGTVDVNISFPASYNYEAVSASLLENNFTIISTELKAYRILSIRVPVSRLGQLALLPYVEFVEAVHGEDKPLSQFWTNWGRDGVRASLLSAPTASGGRDLHGDGVVVGFGDNADPQLHIDFINRLITRAPATYAFHGTHVAGIIGGGGIRNELRVGFAPKATLISQVFSRVFFNAPAYVTDYGMVITNNSYGDEVEDCSNFGTYDLYSRVLDQQAFSLPALQHVFAAGNTGTLNCAPFPDSFHTVLGGYQSAKNILCVGNATPLGTIFQLSGRGPVRDGRIKPEIIATGSFIESTAPPPFDFYWENTGTSMASPAVAGGLALLYERYRQLHPPGLNPKNGLMKALVCNSGDDWGMPGPDYTHGFGHANFWRAVNVLENNQYAIGDIAPGTPDDIIINVPAGIATLKVMLYWNDPAGAAVAAHALVNDLDLEVITPSASTVLPFVLDTNYNAVKHAATHGVDHINNIEQVAIQNPASGNYTIRIKPTSIVQNPSQEYFIVYDFVPVETRITTPTGGETYIHGENVIARWDSYGTPANNFTLEYSINNGANWILLNNNIDAAKREYFYTSPNPNEWFIIPQVATDQALVRITRNGTGISSTTLPFVICDTINASLSAVQCETYFSIDWTAVTGATGYEVMFLQGENMVPVATVSNSTFTYTFSGLSKDSVYWASVRPLIGTSNSPGRRAIAVSRKPDSGTCTAAISDNDIKIDSIISPSRSGRELTSTSLGNAVPVTIIIKNLDNVATTGDITATYILNGTPIVHVITNPAIPGLGSISYTFTGDEIDLSTPGTYTLEATVSQNSDPVAANNSMTAVFKQLANPAILNLVTPFVDNFDSAPEASVTKAQIGLPGLDRYDFATTSQFGRARTFVNTGVAYSGNRAITLDSYIFNPGGTTDSLTGTYNLATFDATTDDIRLDFRFKNHGQESDAANKVWIRGNDTEDWIEAYDLSANQPDADGTYKKTGSIEISDLLRNSAPQQNFSSSFQIRWGQHGVIMAADNITGQGYTFDDITLYAVTDDMQMVSIDSPLVNSCDLSALNNITITVRNSSNVAVTDVPVRFRIDNGSWLDPAEEIGIIPANDTTQYTFNATAILSAFGPHLIEVVVDYPSDTYHLNDTLRITVINSPVITVTPALPYLENFETSNGNWYAGGTNVSWEYGTPASYKINRAASGSKAWKTRLAGNYNDVEQSYLYSPCFNVALLNNPTLSFSVALDLEDCGPGLCDGAYVEYSLDGSEWDTLGAFGSGTNWYNKDYPSGIEVWSIKNYTRWHVATIPLSSIDVPLNQLTQLRFRFVMSSDLLANREGIAIDDIHVYDNPYGIYTGNTMGSPVTQNIPNASGWVDFIQDNQLIASVNSTVAMGSTDAQAYIHTGSVRVNSDQYYHNRNITIKPANVNLSDSAIVRFYFTDTETELLIHATGCAYCFKPSTAYDLGVTKYSDGDDNKENGTLADNTPGNYLFIPSVNAVKVPFDNGYYAEFKVKDFSEFWLNNGGFDNLHPLPVELISFAAKKATNNTDVQVTWITASVFDVNRFEIEVARGNDEYRLNRFFKIGEVTNPGNFSQRQEFGFTDKENNKSGTRYYRLKIVDNDGSIIYSAIRAVVFSGEITWQVNPNPSNGLFHFSFQAAEGQMVAVNVFDVNGKLVKQYREIASGFIQKITVALNEPNMAPGLYLLDASIGTDKKSFKLLKQ